MYLGLDVGGTHTDAVLCAEGRVLATAKVKTLHTDVPSSIHAALAELLSAYAKRDEGGVGQGDSLKIQRITIGTTLGLNALVQDRIAPVGLFITAGPGMDPMRFVEHTPMARYVYRVPGGLDHRGQEVTTLDLCELQSVAKAWYAAGVRHFAIVGKFSPRNAAHEQAIANELLQHIDIEAHKVSLSHNLVGTLNFPRRMAATYFNAAIQAIQREFLEAVRTTLHELGLHAPVFMLQADGGAIFWEKMYQYPLYSVLSGPCASVMGAMALCQQPHDVGDIDNVGDAILLDMGGTTTDIALYAHGVPILDADGMCLVHGQDSYKTPLRSLMTLSLALGGDHVLQGDENAGQIAGNTGQAAAFGGEKATLLDAFNVCALTQGCATPATVGDVQASLKALQFLCENEEQAYEVAKKAVDNALDAILRGMERLMHRLSGKPVYTLEKLLEGYTFKPQHVYFVGAPAQLCAQFLAPYLQTQLNVTVHVPPFSAIANALGAALTLPTAQVELFADTLQGFWSIPTLNLQGRADRKFTLAQATELAVQALQADEKQDVDVVLAESFAILDSSGRGGKDMRIVCQCRPGLVEYVNC